MGGSDRVQSLCAGRPGEAVYFRTASRTGSADRSRTLRSQALAAAPRESRTQPGESDESTVSQALSVDAALLWLVGTLAAGRPSTSEVGVPVALVPVYEVPSPHWAATSAQYILSSRRWAAAADLPAPATRDGYQRLLNSAAARATASLNARWTATILC
eukprot:CAMPEP_0117693942 /NCGR_PEP_ID=MMETSP0804-20121206/27168_1 /TAXON_ID=1074897 /ORGANISM="Tetraselmis astigmatica, Strain CCMP880" /LENGTH=158 /DNA_ID=CAMNT_0005507567 /DNA_START=587 /DNA_END=1064 /DNA_ORIENTATION=+